jgi:hypothetical protein
MTRPRLQFASVVTSSQAPLPPEQRQAWEAAWKAIGKIIEGDMKKQDHFNRLVDLGRTYTDPLLATFPYTRGANSKSLADRCRWMEKAIELKKVDRELAYQVFQAAWSGYLSSDIAQKAGLG